jgi:hypothetical protein
VLPLFGDRILSLFWHDHSLHMVMEVGITATTVGLTGKPVGTVLAYLDCWVLIRQEQQNTILTDGDTLLCVFPVARVKEVLSRCYQAT